MRMPKQPDYAALFADTNAFRQKLINRLSGKLPGKDAQYKLAPVIRLRELENTIETNDAVESSVLIVLYPEQGSISTIVILRNEYEGAHSGQISLPGGRKERDDADNYSTALREAREEIGIDTMELEFCGELSPLFISRSNYIVHPFVAITHQVPQIINDPVEVQKVITFSLFELCGEHAVGEKMFHYGKGLTFNAPGFEVGGHFMWGATAMIFSEFLAIIKEIA